MDELMIKCPAKINISLDVVGKREDGYHLLRMINQSVSLYDIVTVEKSEKDIILTSNRTDIPLDGTNTCYKAAKLVLDRFNIKDGLKIHIEKNIPHGAGLGGGSSDAAGVIKAINKLYDLRMSLEEMMRIGVRVGADVPYCIVNRTSLSEGIGEIITPIEPIDNLNIVIAKPTVSVSTKEVYQSLRLDEITKRPDIERLIEYIKRRDYAMLGANMANVLETVTLRDYPVIGEIKNIMHEFDALGSIMTGSGSAVFGIFDNEKKAEICYNRLRDYLREVYLVKTVNEGV